MNRSTSLTLFILSVCTCISLTGNLLVHVLFYAIDGNMEKLLSPWWISSGILVVVTGIRSWRLYKGL